MTWRAGLAAPAAMLVVRIVMAHAALRRHFSGRTVPALLSGRSLATAHAISMGESGERSARRAQRSPRNQPTFGGSLCSSSGHRLSTTARVSSEMIPVIVPLRTLLWIRCKSAGIITLPPTIRGS